MSKGKLHNTRFLLPLECHEWSAGVDQRLHCAVGHAAIFAVNAGGRSMATPQVVLPLASIQGRIQPVILGGRRFQ